VALGGNLLRGGERPTVAVQRRSGRTAAEALAPVANNHQLVIAHGNGPQVGLLALQAATYEDGRPYPLDVFGAESEGMIGYMIEQELGNLLPVERPLATILTMVEVDADATATYSRYVDRLVRGLAPVINVLDPKIVVLGGSMSNLPTLAEDLQTALPPHVFTDYLATRVLPNVHGDSSGVRGAAWLWPVDDRGVTRAMN